MLNLKKRISEARQNDEGFTLIELAVVILIIGILLALALPAFLGVRKNAADKAAQSAVRVALLNAKSNYSDAGSYLGATTAALIAAEPGVSYVPGTGATPSPSIDSKTVSIAVLDSGTGATADANQVFRAVAYSKGSGKCYLMQDNASAGTGGPSQGTKQYVAPLTAATCLPSLSTTTDPGSPWVLVPATA